MKSFYKKMLFLEAVVLYVMFLLVVVDSSKQEEIQKKAESIEVSLMEYSNEQVGSGDAYIGEKKKVALTFDDGPNDKSTVQILAILKKYDVKATFFVLGQNVVKHLDVVRMIHDQGHEVANHSWSHKNLTKLNPAQMHDEIDRTSDAIFEATGEYPASYRPPYGAIDASVRKEIQLNSVLWNIDTMDWHHKDPVKTLKNVKANAKDGGIILMHDIHQQSADALEAILQYLQQEDYEFVTTKELGK